MVFACMHVGMPSSDKRPQEVALVWWVWVQVSPTLPTVLQGVILASEAWAVCAWTMWL